MSDWSCAIEDAERPGAKRCKSQCRSCAPVSPTALETLGSMFDFANPRPEDIELADIARSLSQRVRFGGFTSGWYSVAEHALLVRRLVIEAGHRELGFAALHHDSHEAYIGDIPTPQKIRMDELAPGLVQALQGPCDQAIAAKFGIDPAEFDHPVVKAADLLALFREAATLKASCGVGPHWGRTEAAEPLVDAGMSPERAEAWFMMIHDLEVRGAATHRTSRQGR